MLTTEETRALLAVAMGYDNRRPGDLNVAAWQMASDIGRWTLDEAAAAIHHHYAVTREWVMPADITQWMKHQRQKPTPVKELALMPEAPPAHEDTVREFMEKFGRDLSWPQSQGHRTPALSVRCPVDGCHAAPGRKCTRPAQGGQTVERSTPHPSRVEQAQKPHPNAQEA